MKYLFKLRKLLGKIGVLHLYLSMFISWILLIILLIKIESYFNTDLVWVSTLYAAVIIVLSEVKILFIWYKYYRFLRLIFYKKKLSPAALYRDDYLTKVKKKGDAFGMW